MNEDSASVAWQWGCLDGGGLVPQDKLHFVELSKNSGHVGPLYIDGHRFWFERVPDDPVLPLRPLLDAFDKQARYANSYYSYAAGDEQTVFPGVCIAWGENGQTFPLEFRPEFNVRIIGFKDDDGFRSTYLLSWYSEPTDSTAGRHKYYHTEGIIYEFHCPKITSVPQVKSYDPDAYLQRTNTGLSVAHNLVWDIKRHNPEFAATLDTDTLVEKQQYAFQTMTQKLYNSPETPNLNTSYDALNAKLRRMAELSRTATPTELQAICLTLNKEIDSYPFQLSWRHAYQLDRLIDSIGVVVPEQLKHQLSSAHTGIDALRNLTEENDSLCAADQEYINRNFWNLSHGPVDYTTAEFTARGEHYSGDSQAAYFHVSGEALPLFHAETTLHNLRPGRYRISAVVRAAEADHSGIHIFACDGAADHIIHKEIPATGGTGGNVWFSALCRFEQRGDTKQGVYVLDINKSTANGGQGYGWNRIYLDDITVGRAGILTYGITTRPEITNASSIGSHWFSACDFIVERVGEQ